MRIIKKAINLTDSPTLLLSPSAASEGLQFDPTTSPYQELHLCLLSPIEEHQLERIPVVIITN